MVILTWMKRYSRISRVHFNKTFRRMKLKIKQPSMNQKKVSSPLMRYYFTKQAIGCTQGTTKNNMILASEIGNCGECRITGYINRCLYFLELQHSVQTEMFPRYTHTVSQPRNRVSTGP